jgi:hypothetical protein
MEILDWFNLDKVIEEQERLMEEATDSNQHRIARLIGEYLTELKERRESELRPATKFLGNSFDQQISHMESELKEIIEAVYSGEEFFEKEVAMEVIDLQSSCQTFLEGSMGLTKDKIAKYRKMVIAKNAARGYYKEDDTP